MRFRPSCESLEPKASLSLVGPAPVPVQPVQLPAPLIPPQQIFPTPQGGTLPSGNYVFVAPYVSPPADVLVGAIVFLTPYVALPENPV